MTRTLLVVAARDRRRAVEIAKARGVESTEVVLLDGPWTLGRQLQLPLYVDSSWSSHPHADRVAEAVSERLEAILPVPARAGRRAS